jgi:hypothetical protein
MTRRNQLIDPAPQRVVSPTTSEGNVHALTRVDSTVTQQFKGPSMPLQLLIKVPEHCRPHQPGWNNTNDPASRVQRNVGGNAPPQLWAPSPWRREQFWRHINARRQTQMAFDHGRISEAPRGSKGANQTHHITDARSACCPTDLIRHAPDCTQVGADPLTSGCRLLNVSSATKMWQPAHPDIAR